VSGARASGHHRHGTHHPRANSHSFEAALWSLLANQRPSDNDSLIEIAEPDNPSPQSRANPTRSRRPTSRLLCGKLLPITFQGLKITPHHRACVFVVMSGFWHILANLFSPPRFSDLRPMPLCF